MAPPAARGARLPADSPTGYCARPASRCVGPTTAGRPPPGRDSVDLVGRSEGTRRRALARVASGTSRTAKRGAAVKPGSAVMTALHFDATTVPPRPPLEPLADLKARLDLLAVVAGHVALKRRGQHEHWGCCPFHADRTPSLQGRHPPRPLPLLRLRRPRRRDRLPGRGRGPGPGRRHQAGARAGRRHGRAPDAAAPAGGRHRARPRGRGAARAGAGDVAPDDDDLARHRALALPDARSAASAGGTPTASAGTRPASSARARPAASWSRSATTRPASWSASGASCRRWPARCSAWASARRRATPPACAGRRGRSSSVAEGVEDALAAAELTGLPAWAALSAGNMAELVLPERFREVLILADRDANGVGQENAAQAGRPAPGRGPARRGPAPVGPRTRTRPCAPRRAG